jgi:hypothetical protein
MSGVITTGAHPKGLWPGVHEFWGREYKAWSDEYSTLFDMTSSNKKYEETVELTGFGLAPVKGEGSSTSYDSETQGVVNRYTNVAYSLGYIVTREEMDDMLYDSISKQRAGALARSMHITKEIVAANVYNRAFSSSYTFGDGKELIATDHPTVNGTQSNELAVAADLSEASLEDLCIQIMNAKNSRGLDIRLMPQQLRIPTSLCFEAERIMKSTLQNDTDNNAINALKSKGMLPGGIFVSHYFTDTDAWFVSTDAPAGMTGFNRVAIEFTQDNDFDTENAKAKCYERYVFGNSDFRGLYGSPGA